MRRCVISHPLRNEAEVSTRPSFIAVPTRFFHRLVKLVSKRSNLQYTPRKTNIDTKNPSFLGSMLVFGSVCFEILEIILKSPNSPTITKSWLEIISFSRKRTVFCIHSGLLSRVYLMTWLFVLEMLMNYWVVVSKLFSKISPLLPGEIFSNLTCAYFSNGLVQPPTRLWLSSPS